MMRLWLALALLVTAPNVCWADGPSFNCKRAKLPDEVTICRNSVLSRDDLETTKLFELMKKTNRAGAITIAKAFLKARRACRTNAQCIGTAQTDAIMTFNQAMGYPLSPNRQTSLPSPSVVIDSSNPWPDAYSRRDFRLGMTLSKFKATPFPDQKPQFPAYLVCSNEQRAQNFNYSSVMPNDPVLQAAGVVGCGFFQDVQWQSGFTATTQEASIEIGVHQQTYIVATHFYFVPDEGGTLRLFWIITQGPSSDFGRLAQIMQAAYGSPLFRSEVWQNQAGGSFANEVYTWSNASSEIELRHFSDTIDRFMVQHRLKALWAKIGAVTNQQNEAAAKRL